MFELTIDGLTEAVDVLRGTRPESSGNGCVCEAISTSAARCGATGGRVAAHLCSSQNASVVCEADYFRSRRAQVTASRATGGTHVRSRV